MRNGKFVEPDDVLISVGRSDLSKGLMENFESVRIFNLLNNTQQNSFLELI